MQPFPLFTYGSLMEGIYNYQKYLVGKTTGKSIKARVKGRLFHLIDKNYPALLKGTDYIYGEIVSLNDFKKDILAIDEMEGFHPENPKKDEYHRIKMDVEVFNEHTKCYDLAITTYVYFYAIENDPIFDQHSQYLPDGNWRNYFEQKNKKRH